MTKDIPLCIDLDGTLARTDLLVEWALMLMREASHLALAMPFWLLHGKAYLNEQRCRRLRLRCGCQ